VIAAVDVCGVDEGGIDERAADDTMQNHLKVKFVLRALS